MEVNKRIKEVVNQKPTDAAFSDATLHRITSYYRLDPDRPDEDDHKLNTGQKDQIGARLLENLKKCLTEGFPVAFGFWFYLNNDPDDAAFDKSKTQYVLKDVWNMPGSKFPRHTFPDDLPEQFWVKNSKGERVDLGGHSVLAIGYNESQKQVLVQNSWGAEWSGDGTFWMPYAWITDFAASNYFWTIRTTPTPPTGASKRWQEVHQEIMAAI